MPLPAEAGIICTRSGIRFDVVNPRPAMVLITDIAYGLSHKCRFGGHTAGWYSVAMHSIQVAKWLLSRSCSREIALAGLLHDAAEAYLADLPTPIKILLPDYCVMEDRIQVAINTHFGLDAGAHEILKVKEADTQQYELERRHLMPDVSWWPNPHDYDCPEQMPFSFPEQDYNKFLDMYKGLTNGR